MADILANADDYTPTSDNGELKRAVSSILDQMSDLHANTTRIANAFERIESLEKDLGDLRTENSQPNKQMIRQSQVIKQHQIFMEKIDAKEREKNLVVTGVPEGTYLDVETDEEKLEKIVEKLDRIEPYDAIIMLKRFGV
ncbi:hypothetical protein CAPTEDRAFT_209563 [Capitella teleta]|uniref:Uncharacterized protein n=1 Tax=Capitella teleta TaxID=283909 RepID=R7UBL7_CAPTE|nr:hypothetical protein CAPTEDRAFT_209563 [Capitella teleta]|eukprot:ELU01198.1 hypothetical protein CAPTEDRAFT_209563 [Capitella teleta]